MWKTPTMHVLQIIFPAKTIGVFHISTLRRNHKPWYPGAIGVFHNGSLGVTRNVPWWLRGQVLRWRGSFVQRHAGRLWEALRHRRAGGHWAGADLATNQGPAGLRRNNRKRAGFCWKKNIKNQRKWI